MTPERLAALTAGFARLRVGVVGDFSLDRYFDIDPARAETSIETGLPVHNVTSVRCSPGAAGNIVQNLGALGAGTLWPLGYCGEDGEGFELLRALRAVPGVSLDNFLRTPERRTFTYTKPLVHTPGQSPVELSRLDLKNWVPMPGDVEGELCSALHDLAPDLDALIVMDQAGVPAGRSLSLQLAAPSSAPPGGAPGFGGSAHGGSGSAGSGHSGGGARQDGQPGSQPRAGATPPATSDAAAWRRIGLDFTA